MAHEAEKETFGRLDKKYPEISQTMACEAREPPQQEQILQFFEYAHLPPHLQTVSEPFHRMANLMVHPMLGLPRNPERTVALRKLLEAKDAAVRAALAK